MDRRTEIRDFLTSRRARITPEQAGLKVSPLAGTRRVAGLRREEVALLAGISVPYYTRLERGDARGATDAVLDAIARALLLDDAERAHLFDLVRAANATAAAQTTRRPARQPVRPELRDMLEAMSGVPAYIRNGRLDILAGNALARALFAPIFTSPARPANAARFTFLDPAAVDFYPDWDAVADQNVATLRAEVGRNPYDKALSDLIGELSTRGDTFRQRWARHEVRRHRAGAKRLNHPLVGQMTFTYETMELAADEGLYLIVCGVAPGSRDAEALDLLASWNAGRPPPHEHAKGGEPAARDLAWDEARQARTPWLTCERCANDACPRHIRYGAQLPTGHSTMHLYPVDGAASRVAADATAFPYRDGGWAGVIVGVDPDPANAGLITRWAQDYWRDLHPTAAGGGYVNFLMDEGQDRVRDAYRGNYDRLARIKGRYDPDNAFRINQNIQPAR